MEINEKNLKNKLEILTKEELIELVLSISFWIKITLGEGSVKYLDVINWIVKDYLS